MCIKSRLATVNLCILPLTCLLVASDRGWCRLTAQGPRPSWLRPILLYFYWLCALSWARHFCLLGCLLPHKLPRGSQLACRPTQSVCLDFLSIPWVAAMAPLGTRPSGPACAAGALSGSRVGSGEGREGGTSSGWGLTLGDLTNQSNRKGSKHNTEVLIEPRGLKRMYLNAC